MTDDQMDARLHAAAERWRTANTAVANTEPEAHEQPVEHVAHPSRRRRYGLLASAAVVAAALVAGGALLLRGGTEPAPSGDTAPLEGHVWLVHQGNVSSSAALYIGRDGKLVADDECRLISGTATVDGDQLTISDQAVRFKTCTDQYGPGFYEDGTALLSGTTTYAITADGLTISRGDKHLDLTAGPDGTPQPTLDFPTFTDTDWQLSSAKDANGVDVPVAGNPRLRVDDQGNITGSDGCNGLQGTLRNDYSRVTFGDIGGTQRGCIGDPGATEQAILDFMHGTAQVQVIAGELTMIKGQAQLVYDWAPDASGSHDPAQLSGKTWHLVSAAGEPTTDAQELTFGTDGSLTGNTGCDAITSATATIEPGLITFHGVPQSDESCTLDSGSTLSSFLQGQQIWTVDNGLLSISAGDAQAFAMTFTTSTSSPPASDTWHLVAIQGGDGRYRNGAPPGEPSTITLNDNGFTVTHECYKYVGDLTGSTISHTLTIGAHPCPFGAGRDESASVVDSILSGSVHIGMGHESLSITHPGVGTLTYATADLAPGAPLRGTHWQLETAVDHNGTDHVAHGENLTINDDRLLADDGANAINATVRSDDATLTLSDEAVGGVGGTGADPVRDTVDDVLQAGAISYELQGDYLTITAASRQLIYRT